MPSPKVRAKAVRIVRQMHCPCDIVSVSVLDDNTNGGPVLHAKHVRPGVEFSHVEGGPSGLEPRCTCDASLGIDPHGIDR